MKTGDLLPGSLKLAASIIAISLVGCATSTVSNAALQGDIATLQREIAAAKQRGELDRGAVRDLALAVARRELRSNSGDAAVERVRELRACVGPLASDFEELADGEDPAAAAATMALLESGRADRGSLMSAHLVSKEPMWRAVAARAAVGKDQVGARRELLTDGDVRVRRAALHASLDDPDPGELNDLVEAARLDPDPLARSLAVQALGALGGAEAVNALRDLWQRAEPQTRQVIVSAWAADKSYSTGGQEQLLRVLDTQQGLVAVVASQQLVERKSEHREQAVQFLRRTIDEGPTDERRLAIRLAPASEASLMEAIARQIEPENGADEQAQVMAAARLLRPENKDAATKKAALSRLGKLSDARSPSIRRQARGALIAARSPSVIPSLEKGLKSKSSEVRRQAGEGLYMLGKPSEAATVLGDERGSVRTRVACAILAQR